MLILVGTDPLRDHPDVRLARRALENVRYKVVVDIAAGDLDIYADASLPGLPVVEKDGHYTDWEGRAQRFRAVREPLGQARSEWRIFQGLSEAMGHDLGFHSLDDLHAEMGALLASAPAAGPGDAGPSGTAETTAPPAEHDPHDLVLFAYPLLVDEGRLSAGADLLKEAFEQEAFVEVSTADAARLGLADGATARVRTEAGEATLSVRVSEHLAAGAVFVPWNQPGFAANTILSGSRIAPVTLEPIEAAAPAEAVRA